MHFSRYSHSALAVLLSFSAISEARVPLVRHNAEKRVDSASGADTRSSWTNRLFGRLDRRQQSCPDNSYYEELNTLGPTARQTFCNELIDIPPATTETTVTSTATIYGVPTGTSTITSTNTTHLATTSTIYETTTSIVRLTPRDAPAAAITPRAAGFAERVNAAVDAVLAGSAPDGASTQTDTSFWSGLATACSCFNEPPTSTVTSTYTAPTVPTIIRGFVQETDYVVTTATDTYYLVTTVVVTSTVSGPVLSSSAPQALSSNAAAASTAAGTSIASSGDVVIGSSVSASASAANGISGRVPAASDVNVTTIPTVTTITSGLLAPSGISENRGVATALPFSCPGDDQKRITNIVGQMRFEYQVLCDRAIENTTALDSLQVAGPTECAAECSFVNAQFGQEVCLNAQFVSTQGGDNCVLAGAATTYADAPGFITAVLLNVFSAGSDCAVVNFGATPSNLTANDTAVISSLVHDNLTISTPPYQFSTGTGGVVFRTRETSYYTLSNGAVGFTWSEYYASSSQWYEIYATSYSCTYQTPRTIIVNPGANVTSIVNGSVTTIYNGTSTTILGNGGGIVVPTSVPATLTGGAAFSTGGAASAGSSNGGAGLGLPPVTSIPTASASEIIIVNGSVINGGGSFSTGGSFETANSTGGAGEIPPTPTPIAGSAALTLSGGVETMNSTGGAGSILPASSVIVGSGALTLSGSAGTMESAGGGGTVPAPSAIAGSASLIISGSAATANSAGGEGTLPLSPTPSALNGSNVATISGETVIVSSTGGEGIVLPTSVLPQNFTTTVTEIVTISTVSGGFLGSASGGTFVSFSTGGAGLSSPIASELPPVSGGFSGSISGGTFTANSTEGGGLSILPTGALTAATESVVTIPSGSLALEINGSTATVFSTGGVGIILPSPSGEASLIISGSTFTINATGGASIGLPTAASSPPFSNGEGLRSGEEASTPSAGLPSVIGNISSIVTTVITSTVEVVILPTGFSTVLAGGTFTANSTGGAGISSPLATAPSGNETAPMPSTGATDTVGPFTNSEGDRNGEYSTTTSANFTGPFVTGTLILPSETLTIPLPSESGGIVIPPLSLNSTLPTGTAGNATLVAPTASTELPFTNSEGGRSGEFSETSMPSSGLPALSGNTTLVVPVTISSSETVTITEVVPLPSGSIPAVVNFTLAIPTPESSIPLAGEYTPRTTTSVVIETTTIGLLNGTVTAVIPIATGTAPLPIVGTDTTGIFTNSEGGRVGSELETPTASGSVSFFGNSTLPLPTATGTTGTFTNSEGPRVGSELETPTASLGVPLLGNSSLALPTETGIASLTIPVVSVNGSSTLLLATGLTAALPSLSIAPFGNASCVPTATISVETVLITHTVLAGTCMTSGYVAPTLSPLASGELVPTDVLLPSGVVLPTIVESTATNVLVPTVVSAISGDGTSAGVVLPIGSSAAVISVVGTGSSLSVILPTYPSTSTTADLAAATAALAGRRAAGEPATASQIADACANSGSPIYNGGFETADASSNAPGWTSTPINSPLGSTGIYFESIASNTTPPPEGTRNGRVVSMDPAASISVTQPVTLCPGRTYNFTESSRQDSLLSQCSVTFAVGNQTLISSSPQESWGQMSATFTAGSSAGDVSVDVTFVVACAGQQGVTSSAVNGQMILEVDDIAVIPVA